MTGKEKPAQEKPIQELSDLTAVIKTLDPFVQAQLTPPLNKLCASLQKRYNTLGMVKEALEQLRVDLKYLVFDLEATTRERDEYKALWENRP